MLEVHLIADNQIRDLLRREADIAIRHVRPDQPDLIARLVQELTANFYASEDYVARRGAQSPWRKCANMISLGWATMNDLSPISGQWASI
jgi:DNA-binding transcriptional LysR family regulator